jgi:hypothetical protein
MVSTDEGRGFGGESDRAPTSNVLGADNLTETFSTWFLV